MSANNNPKGIVLIITAMTFFSMQDALIKFIYEKAACQNGNDLKK